MFDLLWVPNFLKIRHFAILRPNLFKFLISSQNPQFQISYLWLTNLTCSNCQISWHWEYMGPHFPRMRGLILVLMLNMYYLAVAVILIFLVVTWWLLSVTYWLLLVAARYLVVTGGYRSLPLVSTFSMNGIICCPEYKTFCVIWYYLYSLENVKNFHGAVLLLVNLQTSARNLARSNTPLFKIVQIVPNRAKHHI